MSEFETIWIIAKDSWHSQREVSCRPKEYTIIDITFSFIKRYIELSFSLFLSCCNHSQLKQQWKQDRRLPKRPTRHNAFNISCLSNNYHACTHCTNTCFFCKMSTVFIAKFKPWKKQKQGSLMHLVGISISLVSNGRCGLIKKMRKFLVKLHFLASTLPLTYSAVQLGPPYKIQGIYK